MTTSACEACGVTENPHVAECPGVPLFCPLCEADVGPCWPRIGGSLPAVRHLPDGTHNFGWSDE